MKELRIADYGLRISVMIALCALLALSSTSLAQTPTSYLSIAPKLTFASELGYKTPGVGVEVSAGIRLPDKFFGINTHTVYLTEDVERVSEQKRFADDGRTIASTTGLQCHFIDNWFGRVGVSVANHSNSAYSKTATRFQFGGGYSYQSKESFTCNGCLLALRVTAVGFVPVSDPNGGRGVKLQIDGFMPVVRSGLWGVHWKGAIAGGSFSDASGQRRWAKYGDASFGVFLNLSKLTGT